MKQIIYSKFSNERGRKFAIRTDICKDEAGNCSVVKSASYPEGIPHIQKILKWQEELEKIFAGTKIRVNRCKSCQEGIELEYLEQGETLEERMHRLWKQEEKAEAVALMESYLEQIRSTALESFVMTEAFQNVFGEQKLPDGLKTMKVTDLDMVLENILITQDGAWNLIDYEWTFDFPIPVNFVLFRIWHYFLSRSGEERPEQQETYLLQAGISAEEQKIYREMEVQFQKYLTGEHVPIRELYGEISPGAVALQGTGLADNYQGSRTYRSTVYYGPDQNFSEERKISCVLSVTSDGWFCMELPIAQMGHPAAVRWDPLEGQMCRIRFTRIKSQASVGFLPGNGFRRGEWNVFWSHDPMFLLTGDFRKTDRILVEGQLLPLRLSEEIGAISQTCMERDVYWEELERVRLQNAQMRATKAYRAIEGARRVRNYLIARAKGFGFFKDKKLPTAYHQWYMTHRPTEEELQMQRLTDFPQQPKISILVPTYRTPLNFLKEMIESVQAQTYPNWELCIGDGSVFLGEDGTTVRDQALADALEAYAQADSRIKYVLLEKNGGISENTNGAAALATGDYIGLLDHDDILAPDALFEVVQAALNSGADMIYTDEDKVNGDLSLYFDPNLKPDFSPDLLCSHNYITHFLVVKKALFDRTGEFRKEYDGAQDYDLIFRCSEMAEKICHVPKIVYHWRMHGNSTAENPKSKLYAYEAGKKAIEAHLERIGQKAKVEKMKLWGMNHVVYETPGNPLVSIIIPNKDHVKDLNRCICSILKKSSYKNIEILIVENNSTEPATFAYYEKITKKFPQVRMVRWEREFNYSAINNFGVKAAKGEYLLLLNNDTELIEPNSIREMLGHCMRKEVGCVGAKLLFADDTVQHAGIVLGFGGFAGHVFSGVKKSNLGFMMRTQITGNYSAVTAACLMVRKEVYEEVQGFSEEFAVALNDVDFCLKTRKAGYLVVFEPFSLWHHYESKSRGYEDTPEKKERFQREITLFRSIWGDVVDEGDPYYNANFGVDREPFTLG